MPRHHSPTDEGVVVARLDGAARRLLRDQADRDHAIAELHSITTDPRLLGIAAGTALAAWRRDQVVGHDGDRVARMLEAAGADPQVRDETAAATLRRLSVDHGRSGIGNP